MLNFKYIRAGLMTVTVAALTWSSGASPQLMIGRSAMVTERTSEPISVLAGPMDANSTFYSARRDLRRCISPLCGGYFVKRVNRSSTRCANGRFMRECYVAEINWNGQPQLDDAQLLVRGNIVAKRYERFGNLGELRVGESWKSVGANEPAGIFYLVRDRGVRCIAFPCPTHTEAKLNSSSRRNIAGVNLDSAALGENNAPIVEAAMTGPDGVIITGDHVAVRGPGGRFLQLKAAQVYFRNKSNSDSSKSDSRSMKPCFKTGCSSQVCADHNVVTTCEFRPEYACYQKATCERQADGNCGFTKTPELTACLGRR